MKILANDGISQAGINALESAGFTVITEKVAQEDLNQVINDQGILLGAEGCGFPEGVRGRISRHTTSGRQPKSDNTSVFGIDGAVKRRRRQSLR